MSPFVEDEWVCVVSGPSQECERLSEAVLTVVGLSSVPPPPPPPLPE